MPPYRKERLRTCRIKVAYCTGITGMEAQMEKARHCTTVMASDSTQECRSATASRTPEMETERRLKGPESTRIPTGQSYEGK